MTKEDKEFTQIALIVLGGFLALVATGMAVIPWYGRYQNIMDAENQVHVTAIRIGNTEQLIEVEKRKAEVRVQEAKGIADSQRIIDASLTLNYLQYLAIQAQEQMAHSPNHTQIYIPVGTNGIPLVRTVNP